MNSIDMELQSLTPLWTGGSDKKVDRIHETGLLGSLRWWYEALVRGLGGDVCDAVSSSCVLDAKKYTEGKNRRLTERELLRYAGLCDACQLFGATGWRRRFRLSINDTTQAAINVSDKIALSSYSYKDKSGKPKTPTWYFTDKPRQGILTIKIHSLASSLPTKVVAGLVQFVSDWTAIGARAQMGFGVVQIQGDRVETVPLYNHLMACQGSKTYSDMPCLNNMFLARIKVTNQHIQETFNLKL